MERIHQCLIAIPMSIDIGIICMQCSLHSVPAKLIAAATVAVRGAIEKAILSSCHTRNHILEGLSPGWNWNTLQDVDPPRDIGIMHS